MKIRLLTILVALLTASSATGQSPYFKNYQVRDGLPSNNVYFVFQDSKGYVWLCTDTGVSRFDGARFTNFTTADGLTDNEVFTCFEDRAGRIWFATLNGRPCFFYRGKMHSEHDTPLLRGAGLGGLIVHIFQEETGEVVMASSQRLGKLNLENGTVQFAPMPIGTIQIWDEPGPEIGLLTNDGLGYLQDGKLVKTASLPNVRLPVKHAQSGDTLFLAYARNLLVYSLKKRQTIQLATLPASGNEAISVTAYGQRIWVGDRRGSYLLDRKTLARQQTYLPGSQVSAMLEDREGGWWFSTLDHGIFYVPAPEIRQYSSTSDGQPLRINCLSGDPSGRLWAGMNESTHGILDGQSWQLFKQYPPLLKPRAVSSIRHFPNGTTLLAGKAGLLEFRGGNRRFFRLRSSDVNLDPEGNLWLGLTGLFFIPADQLSSYALPNPAVLEGVEPAFYLANPPRNLSGMRVDKIVFDHNATAWLAAPTGLFFYKNGAMSSPVLPHATRDLLFEETTQLLWALTESNGLFLLRNGQPLDSIRIANGQGPVICRSLCADGKGSHWLATASGLFKVEGSAGGLRLLDFTKFHGMGGEKLNAVAVLNGQVFMGKDDGLMAAPLSLFDKKIPPPPVYLKELVVNGREAAATALPLRFGPGDHSLTLGFEGLSFKDFKKLHYRYRLHGHDANWHTTTNEAVEYASLRPGQYRFEVVAVNSSGVESTAAATCSFSIAPPFWMRWWFFLAVVAAVAGLVFSWVKWREKKLRQQYEYQQKLMESENGRLELQKKNADLKMLALRLQMNPHFLFNALNTIKGYYGQDKITQANSYIAKFARLLRLNLDYSDTFIPLDQEIELLRIYMQLSQIRYPGKMDFRVEMPPDLSPTAVRIPSMVIQPFVENAVIHGIVGKEGRGEVALLLAKTGDGEIMAIVRDTGVGRAAANARSKLRDPHKPLATAITQERLQLLRKNTGQPAVEIRDLYDENGAAAGTEVVLRLPVEKTKSHDPSYPH